MWSAKPGMQVVCLNSEWYPAPAGPQPQKGQIYTIRAVRMGQCCDGISGIGLLLEEIHNPLCCHDGTEPGYVASFFRPCAPTDIGALRALLAPQPARGRKVEVVE